MKNLKQYIIKRKIIVKQIWTKAPMKNFNKKKSPKFALNEWQKFSSKQQE